MSDRFATALTYAVTLHRDQVRKGSGCPYVSHLLAVASLVMEAGGSEVECIAALLHDAVEDQGGARTAAEIRRRFGGQVADIVETCTEDRTPGRTWKERKRGAIRKVAEADGPARLVLSADKLHNARSLIAAYRRRGERLWERFRGGRDETLWYYRTMSEALALAGGSPLQDELERSVRDLEAVVSRREGR